MYILKDNQIPGRFYGGNKPVYFDDLEEVKEVLRDLIEMDMDEDEATEGLALWALLDIADYDLIRI